ncbi:Leucine rich repeat proteins, some proteins contain F-box [Phaffia rhodozyma]|uniref:Leucine rich repeat proteins, some proteins contain F-box n=1 Tax=Phaffia rhodozyma TaxID=264483 RepID=A0A0F7SHQ7_PHARH|nr:Leucine rich repeat proteins, some proteins contain F-box [Phaffia rhodozyma]
MPPRRQGGVTGPTSALTSFLREQGITAPTGLHYRNPLVNGESQTSITEEDEITQETRESTPGDQSVAGPGPSSLAAISRVERSAARGNKRAVIDPDSSDLDASDSDSLLTPAQKRLKAAQKKAFKAKRSRLSRGDDDDDDFSDDETPAERNRAPASGPPLMGAQIGCGECGKTFSYTKYSPPSPDDPSTYLCRPCAVTAGLGAYKGPAAAKKKPVAKVERRKIVHYEERERIPALTDICISLVAKYSEDVESLGDIGPKNMEKVNNIICKSRKMTGATAQLFYEPGLTKLTMRDCTLLTDANFITLGQLTPCLTELSLSLCGQLKSSALLSWGKSLVHLKRLELYGPFLVRKEGWLEFMDIVGSRGGLDGFLIRQSPRFDRECLEKLVEKNPGLKELRLSEIGKLDESWLPPLCSLQGLTYLDVSLPTRSFPSPCPELTAVLTTVGSSLRHLSLGSHVDLQSTDLLSAIAPFCGRLESLDLSLLPELDDEGTASFFDAWSEARREGGGGDLDGQQNRLLEVNLQGNWGLQGKTIYALAGLAGTDLERLNVSGWKTLEKEWMELVFGPEGRPIAVPGQDVDERGRPGPTTVLDEAEEGGKEEGEGETERAHTFTALKELDTARNGSRNSPSGDATE